MNEAANEGGSVIPTANLPTQRSERIVSIDVLRGFALLGILMMNIQSFGLIDAKYLNPMAQGELSGISYACWLIAYLFFDLKFMTLFSALFGAGIVLMWERARAAGRKSTGLHYRRMFWLLLIGLFHAHLLWYGDILVPYALCGMLVYWLSGLRPRWLFLIGLILFSVGSGISVLTHFSVPYWEEAQVAEMIRGWAPNAEQIEEALQINRSGWLAQIPHRSMLAFMMETFLFAFLFFWRISGLMLMGMALFKMDVLNAKRSLRFYRTGAMVGLAIGLPMVVIGVIQFEAHHWSFEYSFFLGNQFNYWGSVPISFAYVCLVMLVCKSGLWRRARQAFASVGQMALTNYLAHTLVCTTIFYGHGLGWYGYLDRIQLVGIVLVIWVVQMILSPIWLNHFRFGPFEWVWRSLAYWKLQPMWRVHSKHL